MKVYTERLTEVSPNRPFRYLEKSDIAIARIAIILGLGMLLITLVVSVYTAVGLSHGRKAFQGHPVSQTAVNVPPDGCVVHVHR